MVGLQQQYAVAAQPVVLGGRVNVSHARRRASSEEHSARRIRRWEEEAQDVALAAEPGRKRAGWWSGVLLDFASGQVVSEGVVSRPP